MKNMKKWKRLLAVGMCSAMMFSMSVGVSATENQDTEETTVAETQEEEETAPEEEAVLKGDSGVSANKNDKLPQVDKEALEKAIENAVKPESTVEVTETEEDSDELPIVEWDNKFTVSSQDGTYGQEYFITLGENWRTECDDLWRCSTRYVNGVKDSHFHRGSVSERKIIKDSYSRQELAFESFNITYKFDRLLHYTNGVIDGVAKDVEITYVTKVESNYETEGKPQAVPTYITYDGTQDLVFRFQDGVGDYAIKEIKSVEFLIEAYDSFYAFDYTYDVKAGELRIPYYIMNQAMAHKNQKLEYTTYEVLVKVICQNGQELMEGTMPIQIGSNLWVVEYAANDWSSNGDMPKFIDTSYEFDGTQDMEFNFENGTGDNKIVSVNGVYFPIQERNATAEDGSYLQGFRIDKFETNK